MPKITELLTGAILIGTIIFFCASVAEYSLSLQEDRLSINNEKISHEI